MRRAVKNVTKEMTTETKKRF